MFSGVAVFLVFHSLPANAETTVVAVSGNDSLKVGSYDPPEFARNEYDGIGLT